MYKDLRRRRIYGIWHKMVRRCTNEGDKDFKFYGARGIFVCREWLENFDSFYEWSLLNGYSDKLTLERNDVNGIYEPSNCRWATVKEQANNKRTNHLLTYKGQTKTFSQWAEITGIGKNTIWARWQRGLDAEKILSK